jgi:hypothetical protein
MVRKPTQDPQTREALEVLAEYERRLAQGPGTLGEAAPAARDEIDDYLRLHQRVAALELPAVAPSVRGVVLGAAFEQVEKQRQESGFARWIKALLRPGPMVVMMAGAAVVLALVVRPDRHATPESPPPEAVAMAEAPPAPQAAAPAEPAAEAPDLPVEAAAAAPAPAAAPAAVTPAPLHTIEAEPASLGPVAADGTNKGLAGQDKPAAGKKEWAAKDDAKAAFGTAPQAAFNELKAEKNVEDYPQGLSDDGFAAPPPARANSAPEGQLAKQASASAEAEQQAALRETLGSGRAARAEATPSRRPAPSSAPAPVQAQAAEPDATAATIAKLREQVGKTSDPDARAALLGKILVLARKSADRKTEQWAQAQLDSGTAKSGAKAKMAAPADEQVPAESPQK